MKTSKFTDEQIAMALRQAEAGTPVGEIRRKLGVSEQSFYRWKKRFGTLGFSELRELRQLRSPRLRRHHVLLHPGAESPMMVRRQAVTLDVFRKNFMAILSGNP